MDRTEVITHRHFYWTEIRTDVRKEVNICDTCQRTKRSNIQYGRLPAKEADEIPRKKLYLDVIGCYTIQMKGKK